MECSKSLASLASFGKLGPPKHTVSNSVPNAKGSSSKAQGSFIFSQWGLGSWKIHSQDLLENPLRFRTRHIRHSTRSTIHHWDVIGYLLSSSNMTMAHGPWPMALALPQFCIPNLWVSQDSDGSSLSPETLQCVRIWSVPCQMEWCSVAKVDENPWLPKPSTLTPTQIYFSITSLANC